MLQKAQGSRSFTVHFRCRPPLWSPEKKGDGGENTKACETEIGLGWGRENANRDWEGEAAPVAAWSAVLRRLWRRSLRREERGRNRRVGEERRYVEWEGVSWVFIYIHLWKLPLTTLSFILNYISSPKVCIYYFYSLFLLCYFLGFKNISSWKFIAPIKSFYYTYLNPKLTEI